jgi:putative ABC transport system permease protein
MEIRENLKMAFAALLSNKLRSSLTMLGIAIGNASVIALVGVGQGAQKLAEEQFQSLGPNVLFITLTRGMRRTLGDAVSPLVLADAEAIWQVPSVIAVSPELHSSQVISYRDQTINNPTVGVTDGYLSVRNFKIAKGRFINEVDLKRSNRVVILGAGIAKRLFAEQNPIGEQVRIRNASFEVIGVLGAKGTLFGSNQDDNVVVPLTTLSNQLVGRTSPFGIELSLISIAAKDEKSLDAAQFQIENLLQLRHPTLPEGSFRIFPQQQIIEMKNKTNEGLTQMLAAIASISLLVGGIGVMNIMLVSVTERRQEIGLRKAIGAQEQDILVQFLIEAVILATTGGVFGIFVGVGGIAIAGAVGALSTSISPVAILLGVVVSGGIGLFFGVLPAQRAAKLDPIVALRSS